MTAVLRRGASIAAPWRAVIGTEPCPPRSGRRPTHILDCGHRLTAVGGKHHVSRRRCVRCEVGLPPDQPPGPRARARDTDTHPPRA